MDAGDYIGSTRDVAKYFGKYMDGQGPYKAVSPGFLLEVLRQDWLGQEAALYETCRRLQGIATRRLKDGEDVGPLLDLRSVYPDFGIPMCELWHFQSPIMPPPKLRPQLKVDEYGVHPDVAVGFLLDQNIPASHRQVLEDLHAELQFDSDHEPTAVLFAHLAGVQFPRFTEVQAWTGELSPLIDVTTAVDLIELLIAINRVSTPPILEDDFRTFVSDRGAPIDRKTELRFTCVARKLKDWGRTEQKLIVDGREVWTTPGIFSRLLAFAIPKLVGSEPPGLTNKNPTIRGIPIQDIVRGWTTTHKGAQRARLSFREVKGEPTHLLQNHKKPVSHIALKWRREQIDIEDLKRVHATDPTSLDDDVLALMNEIKDFDERT